MTLCGTARARAGFALLAAIFVLAACTQPPAPVRHGTALYTKGGNTPDPAPERPGESRAAQGDVAKVPLPAPRRPSFRPSSRLASGSGTDAGGTGVVTVAPGDTVYAIARRHRVGVRDIIALNQLAPPYRLLVGQHLRLPGSRRYAVVSGDTVYGLSRRFGVDTSTLVRLNRLRPPYRLVIGQLLEIPTAVRAPEASATAARSQTSGTRSDEVAASSSPDEAPAPRIVRKSTSGSRFMWPAEGRLISTYGDKGGGNFNEGINIAAAAGSDVVAAADGTVTYAGNELRGYGNLLLIRHADGWMSAYAHNEELLVGRGDRVVRGQAVATVGRTGNVARPQSHFELRRGGKAVDPLRYLPRQTGAG